jgi:hypothetical protein
MDGNLDRRSALRFATAAGLSAVLAACAGRAEDTPPGAVGPDTLMFIRHAEEPESSDGSAGVTQIGAVDRRSLSVRGWTRAGALVALFDPRDADGKPLPTRPQLARPTTICASDPGQSGSRRSLETVTPLAAALNLQVDARFTSTATKQVADAIRSAAGPVLVAWKHDQIVDIISHLTDVTPPPPPWPGGRYDLVYVLSRNGGGWRFAQVPQMLLAGDRKAPGG